jgi:hypothetical protein
MPDNPFLCVMLYLLSLPIVIAACMFPVLLVVELSDRRLGRHKIHFRPIRSRIADFALIAKLWLRSR